MLTTGPAQRVAASAYANTQKYSETDLNKNRAEYSRFGRVPTLPPHQPPHQPESGLSVILLQLKVTFSGLIELIALTVGQRAIRRPLTPKED